MRVFKAILISMALLLGISGLSACGSSDTSGTDRSVHVNDHERVEISNGPDIQIYDVTLLDGTRCIITAGARLGGVSCDFTGK